MLVDMKIAACLDHEIAEAVARDALQPVVEERDAGLGLLPFGRLRDPVGLAQDVGFPRIEPDGALGDVVLVVQVLGDPDMGDGEREGGRGGRARRQPLAAGEGDGLVEIRVDVDALDAELGEPAPPRRALVPAIAARGRFRVGRPCLRWPCLTQFSQFCPKLFGCAEEGVLCRFFRGVEHFSDGPEP